MTHLERFAESQLPTSVGEFRCIVYRTVSGVEHIALIKGTLDDKEKVLCRVHSECLTGEVFGSLKCDCRQQLEESLKKISQAQFGVLIYLRQEGRGIGLGNKIRAYSLQDEGLDTVDANRKLGLPDDARDYKVATDILRDLGIRSVVLITNNPNKVNALVQAGFKVERQGQVVKPVSPEAQQYIKTKQGRMGHLE